MKALPQIQLTEQEPGEPLADRANDTTEFDSIVDSQSRSIRKIKSNMLVVPKKRPPLHHSKS
jgi:hypothetical protein